MTRGSTIIWGNDELTRAPAPDAKRIRRDTFQLGARSAPLTRSHSLGPRNESASASMQTGIHTSPGLFASTVAVSRGEETTSHSFRRPFLLQFAIDVAAVLFAILLVAVTGFGLAFAVFAVLFL